jgi:hypothetical protein
MFMIRDILKLYYFIKTFCFYVISPFILILYPNFPIYLSSLNVYLINPLIPMANTRSHVLRLLPHGSATSSLKTLS